MAILMASATRFVNLFAARTAQIYVPAGCCTDMRGAIRAATNVDPRAKRIDVFAGDSDNDLVHDITYMKVGKKWQALKPVEKTLPVEKCAVERRR